MVRFAGERGGLGAQCAERLRCVFFCGCVTPKTSAVPFCEGINIVFES